MGKILKSLAEGRTARTRREPLRALDVPSRLWSACCSRASLRTKWQTARPSRLRHLGRKKKKLIEDKTVGKILPPLERELLCPGRAPHPRAALCTTVFFGADALGVTDRPSPERSSAGISALCAYWRHHRCGRCSSGRAILGQPFTRLGFFTADPAITQPPLTCCPSEQSLDRPTFRCCSARTPAEVTFAIADCSLFFQPLTTSEQRISR